MKKIFIAYLIAFVASLFLSGCELIGDIFQAGVWVGVILVLAIIVLIFRLLSGGRK
jgi:uncharacterized membrane protein YkvI